MPSSSSPVIIAGMHRSGTSLLTSIMAASGIDVGEQLVPADQHNRRGYFEDVDFLSLNRSMLAESCDANDGGHPDWGWTESESLDRRRFELYRADAVRLTEKLSAGGGRRGFKDPRATLLLDFWDELISEAHFLLVYRLPWEVADSMQRLGADVFLRHPEYALQIWTYYNRHLLDFYRRNRQRCLLVSTNALLRQPEEFGEELGKKLDLELDRTALEGLYEQQLLASSTPDDPLIGLVAATSPAVIDLLEQLDREADLPSGDCWQRPKQLRAPVASDQPQVSVVIPCRDHGQFLVEAVASVERVIDVHYELIIVDDGSKQERTLFVLEQLARSGYRIERLEGLGLSAARNRGFSAASAEFVLPLDADNRLREGFIRGALAAIEGDPEIGAVYGEPWEFGQREGRREVPALDIDRLLAANYIDACSLVRKAMWWDVGGYDEALPAWEDWDFWIRVATRGWAALRLDTIAFDYRVRPNSLVTITEQEEVLESIVDRITSKHRQLFHGHLTRRLGHALAAWPRALERERQRLAGETNALRERFRDLEGHLQEVQGRQRELDGENAELRLQLERQRIERLEAEKLAERGGWQVERARLGEEKARTEAELREALLGKLQEQVDEQHRQLEDRCRQVAERQQRCEELHRQLDDRDRRGEEARQRLEDLESRFERRAARLAEQESRLQQQGALVEEQQALLEDRGALLEGQRARLADQEMQLERLVAERADMQERLEELDRSSQERLEELDRSSQERLEELARSSNARLEEIARISNARARRLEEAEAEIRKLRGELERERRTAAERLQVLEQIHASRAFRWLKLWWRLVPGRRRREPSDESPLAGRSPVEDGAMGG